MDFRDNASAIDDSFGAANDCFVESGREDSSDPAAAVTREDFGYNGPRSGHWTVRGTVHGSAIDDGCPTLHHLKLPTSPASGHAPRLPASVIRKLEKATEHERKLEQDDKTAKVAKGDSDINEKHHQEVIPELPQLSKGFCVPQLDAYGIRIKNKNGKEEVVRSPQIRSATPKTTGAEKKQVIPDPAPRRASPIPQEPSEGPGKEPSVVSRASQRSSRTVRILGKNGEEIFMELPNIPAGSRSASQASSEGMRYVAAQAQEPTDKEQQATKAQRDARAARIARELRQARELSTPVEQPRTQDAMMLGALPPPSKASSVIKAASVISARSSPHDSGVLFRDVFDNRSRPPSVASSKTSIAQSRTVSNEQSITGSAQQSARPQSRPPSMAVWQEMGSGILEAAAVASNSERSVSARSVPEAGITSAHQSWHETPDREAITNSFHSSSNKRSQAASQSRHDSKQSHSRPPTIYAGRGWISPHPLSVAPSEYNDPPDEAIRIPDANGNEGATMTYDEWKSMRQSDEGEGERARRNFSRSSSDAGSYSAGSWGWRNRQDSGSVRSQKSYGSAVVESKQSRGTREHSLDGAREEGGVTQLRMPWDDQIRW